MLDFRVEEYVCVGEDGNRVETPGQAMLHGYMDVLCDLKKHKTTLIEDWKSGRWEKDNELERHEYALLGRAVYPQNNIVIFRLVFLRTGHILETKYEWSDDGNSCTVTHDGGKPKTLHGDGKDPILEYFHVRMRKIARTAPKPKPGAHCEKWFGKPCQFLGVECPLSADLPNVVEELTGKESKIVSDCYLKIVNDPNCELSEEQIALAVYANTALKKNCATVSDTIQEWSKKNGAFALGDTIYGWHARKENTVDVPFVLATLYESGLPMDEIAKCVNVSKTSIGKLSKREHPDLRRTLEDWAITTQDGKPKFGVMSSFEDAITMEGE